MAEIKTNDIIYLFTKIIVYAVKYTGRIEHNQAFYLNVNNIRLMTECNNIVTNI